MSKTMVVKSILIFASSFLLKNDLFFLNQQVKNDSSISKVKSRVLDVFYNKNHTADTIFSSYNESRYYYSTLAIPIGLNIPIFFDNVKVIDPESCYVKTSWGNSAYYGRELWKIISRWKFLYFVPNMKVISFDMIRKYANIPLLDIKEYYMSAYIISKQYIGFTWYYNNFDHQFYLELLVYFYTYVWGSSIGGARWLNIGKGLEITVNQ